MSSVSKDGLSLRREAIGGMVWFLAQSVFTRGFGLLSQLVLAWLLTPQDFGVIGLATTVTALGSTLLTLGIDEVLLQRTLTLRLWITAAFLATSCVGVFVSLLTLLAAPLAGALYHSNQLSGLVSVIAFSFAFEALAVVPGTCLRADMRFRLLATYNMVEIIGLQGGAIILAACGAGPYSFAIPIPCMTLVKAIIFWWKAPVRVWPRLKRRHLLYLAYKGSAVLAQRMMTTAVGQGDYVILGLLASETTVGTYLLAFRLSAQPVRVLAGSFQNVLFPVLARLRMEPTRQGQAALKAAEALGYGIMPFCFLQAALAAPIFRLVLGEKWQASIVIAQILSIGLAFDAISWIAGCLLAARAEFERAFRYSVLLSPPFFLLAYVGARLGGAEGVAICVSAFYVLVTPIYSWLVFKRVGITARDMARFYLYPSAAAGSAIGVAYLLSRLVHNDLVKCVIVALLGPALYILVMSVQNPALLKLAFGKFSQKLKPLTSGSVT